MNEHTPGPWKAQEQGVIVWDRHSRAIASVLSGNKADARLIAAAPDLLAALGALANWIDIDPDAYLGDDDGSLHRVMSAARAAIARVQS